MVLKYIGRKPIGKDFLWLVRCDCGQEKIVTSGSLKNGIISCGCYALQKKKDRKVNLVGKRYDRLIVQKEMGKNKHGQFLWECLCDCGNKKVIVGMSLISGDTHSCGCFNKEASYKRLNGINHWNYNPLLTNEYRKTKRNLRNGYDWTKDIFRRDNFTCQICFERGCYLTAHHLNGWHWFKEGRFDMSNGITLCRNCHEEFHKTFGKTKNTKEQFGKFIKVK